MTASQAVAAMRSGVLSAIPDAVCVGVPMADGGEGTVDAIVDALNGRHIVVDVQDPLGRLTRASYGYVPHRRLAVMEIAPAAGLELVAPTSETYCTPAASASATHQAALDHGATEFLVGLGGSATNG